MGSDLEQVLVDVNREAAGKECYSVLGRAVSPKQDLEYLAISQRSEGLMRLRFAPWSALDRWAFVRFDEPAYTQGFSVNREQDSTVLRYTYSSLTTPDSIYQLDMCTREHRLLKQDPVPGYEHKHYATERLWAPASDGRGEELPGDAGHDKPQRLPRAVLEPAKWVAKLRATKTDRNPLLFKINMAGSDGGRSGRFESMKETAEEYAFFLHLLGIDG